MSLISTAIVGSMLAAPMTVPKIVGATLFRNGYSLITRRVDATSSEVIIDELPNPTLGTFWIITEGKVGLKSATTTVHETTTPIEASNMDEFLRANVGKRVILEVETTGNQEGTLVGLRGDVVVLKTESGTYLVPKGRIKSLRVVGDAELQRTSKVHALRLRLDSPTGGTVYLVGLEPGLTWSAAYYLDITDPKRLSLVAKGTVQNDIGDLLDVDARLATGFPTIAHLGQVDPLFSLPATPQPVNVYAGDMQAMETAKAAPVAVMRGVSAPPVANMPTDQSRELFFYKQPGLSLERGERGYFPLFTFDTDYRRVYVWDAFPQPIGAIDPNSTQPVWLAVNFKNTSPVPLTDGAVAAYENGQIVGEQPMTYTPVGAEAEVRLSQAPDIRANAVEEEVSRDRAVLTIPNRGTFDLIHVKVTLTLENFKKESIHTRIGLSFEGKQDSASPSPKLSIVPPQPYQPNPTGRAVWEPTVGAGEKATITMTYSKYVMS